MWSGLEDLGHDGGYAVQVLEIVEYQQLPPGSEVGEELRLRVLVTGEGDPEGFGDRLDDVVARADVGQADKEHPIGVVGADLGCGLDGQPGLAGAARGDHGEQTGLAYQAPGVGQLRPASNELGQLLGEIVGNGGERRQWREFVW